jgi:hypothetical protein
MEALLFEGDVSVSRKEWEGLIGSRVIVSETG